MHREDVHRFSILQNGLFMKLYNKNDYCIQIIILGYIKMNKKKRYAYVRTIQNKCAKEDQHVY